MAGRADRWGPGLALIAVLGLAAGNFAWQLGSSSLFVDEVYSLQHSTVPVGALLHVVRVSETTPPAYFLFLHEWLGRSGLAPHEWVLRLPSAVAGVALVGAVWWLGGLLGGRRVALLAALLCALSPIVLQYAQQARVYALAMLALTLAVAAALQGDRGPRRRGAWLALSAALCVLAMWLHYTAAIAVAILAIWVALRPGIGVRVRVAFGGACLLGFAALVPVLHAQYQANPNGGLVGLARLNGPNLLRVTGTPFDGRAFRPVDLLSWLGAIAVVGALLGVVAYRRRPGLAHRELLVALAAAPPLAMLALSALGKDVLITRYTAVAAPFMLVAIAAAAVTIPRWAAAPLLLAALTAAVLVTGKSHRRSGFYEDARGAIAYVGRHRAPGDVLATPGTPDPGVPLRHYAALRLRPQPTYVDTRDARALDAQFAARRRVWLVGAAGPRALAAARAGLRAVDYRATAVRRFPGNVSLLVVLAVPRSVATR